MYNRARKLNDEEITLLREYFRYDAKNGWLYAMRGGPSAAIGRRSGHIKRDGYVYVCFARRIWPAHRLIWAYAYGANATEMIDHINGVRSDNRLVNLRLSNESKNQANSKLSRANTSGLKGVTWNRASQKWQSSIKVNGRSIYLGLYDRPEDAHSAYICAAVMHFGEHARAG